MLRFTGTVTTDDVERVQRPAVNVAVAPWSRTGACDVELLLIWAVTVQKIGRGGATRGLLQIEAQAMGMEWRVSSTDGCAAIAQIGGLGCKIDVSPGAPGGERMHPAADLVAEVLETMPQGGLLFDYALAAGRPEGWREPRRWVKPVNWVEHEIEAMWVYEGRRHGPRYCPVVIAYSDEALRAGREEYQRWWEALQDAAWLLGLRSLGFRITGPAASAAPWLDVKNGG